MGLNSIFQMKLYMQSDGVEMLNVFHYIQTTTGTIPGDQATTMNDEFWDSIDVDLLNILHPETTVLRSELVELDFLSVNNVKTINAVGTWIDANAMGVAPSFISAGFRFNRLAVGQRHGYKRFSGIALESMESGEFTSAMLAECTNLSSALVAGFVAGTVTFKPFVAHRPIVLGTNPTGYIPGSVSGGLLGTQNTRKD